MTSTQPSESWWKVSEERQVGGLLPEKDQRERMPHRVEIYVQRGWVTYTRLRESLWKANEERQATESLQAVAQTSS